MEFVGYVHRRRLAMEAEPGQTITAEELDVRLRFMMDDEFAMLDRVSTRGNVTGPFVVRAPRVLLRRWDAVNGTPSNNEQHTKQINIGTLIIHPTKTDQTAFTLHGPSPVLPKQILDSSALRQCF